MSGMRSGGRGALVGAWLGLAAVLLANRWWILQLADRRSGSRPLAAWLVVAAYQDLLLVAALAALALAAQRRASQPWARAAVEATGLAIALGAAAYAVLATHVFSFLGTPLTFHLVHLSDHLRGIRASLAEAVSADRVALVLAAPALVAVAAAAGGLWPRAASLEPRPAWRRAALAAFAAYVAVAAATTQWLGHDTVVNPHWAMLRSLVDRGDRPVLAATGDVDLSDVRPPAPGSATNPRSGAASGASVVVVVLESVGTAHLAAWGAPRDVTPELTRLAGEAIVFDRVYAPQPRTSSAMAALFCSVHPWARRSSVVRHAPRFDVPGLADVLAAGGWRTAFLHGGDLSFDREREFLEAHGFATVRDVADLAPALAAKRRGGGSEIRAGAPAPRSERLRHAGKAREARRARRAEKARRRAGALPDRDLLQPALQWIDAAAGQPFLLVLWTLQTHHPYASDGRVEAGTQGEESLGRYLAALRESDRVLGELRRGIEARGLASSTLWVVVGDHGEAFGEHGHSFHGRSLYDEEVRVPLLLAHPRLDGAGTRMSHIGQQTDVAPTIVDLLGLDAPAQWQGRSLFAPQRPERAYLVNVFDDYLVGLVEGDRKYVFGELATRREVYDLTRDPAESVDLSGRPEERERLDAAHRRVAAWLRFQDEVLSRADAGR